jgi:lipoprotein-anchoring transpeptidase ErfK/SrfK
MSTKVISIGAGVFLALALLFVGVVFLVDSSSDDEIVDGVHVGRVDVGGLDVTQARERVRSELAAGVGRPVSVRYRSRRFVLDPGRAQVRLDVDASVEAARRKGRDATDAFGRVLGGARADTTVAPRVTSSRAAVQTFVAHVAERVDSNARDADIDIRNGKLTRRHARSGIAVKRPQLVAAILARLTAAPRSGDVELPVAVTERPDRTLADLARRYPTVIGVDRDAKRLRLYKRLRLVHTYDIAVGMAGLETAAGRYEIKEKQVDPAWHVPTSAWAGDLAGKTIPPGDPQNPLEARWMGFHDGQGIHGTADLASLGTAASHGCIRMSVPAVKELYSQVKVGTPLFLQ